MTQNWLRSLRFGLLRPACVCYPIAKTRTWQILHAEIYPSFLRVPPLSAEVKDAAQVRNLATHFAELDEAGHLADLFAGPATLTAAERDVIEREEGWTLGAGASLGSQIRDRQDAAVVGEPAEEKPFAPLVRPEQVLAEPQNRGTKTATDEIVLRPTGLPGTDHGQSVYVLLGGLCDHEYGANGSDIFQRRCPLCQGGRPGLKY